MRLGPVIARLAAQCPGLRHVEGAAEYAQLVDAVLDPPCAYVLALAEDAGSNGLANAVSQRITVRFGVLLCVRSLADATGAAGVEVLEDLRDEVRAALLGWAPADAEPIEYAGGALLDVVDGELWWQDGWRTAHHIRAT